MKRAMFWAPLAAACFGVLFFAVTMWPRGEKSKMHLSKAANLPVLQGGRVKPLDSYARVQLMLISNRQTYYDEKDDRQQAVRWLFNLMAAGYAELVQARPFDIPDPQVQAWYGLKGRPMGQFLLQEIVDSVDKKQAELEQLVHNAKTNGIEQLSRLELGVLSVYAQSSQRQDAFRKMLAARKELGSADKARVFRIDNDQVLAMLNLKPREGLRYSNDEILGRGAPEVYVDKREDEELGKDFRQFYNKAMQAASRPRKDRDLVDAKVLDLLGHLQTDLRLKALDIRNRGEENNDRLLMVPGTSGGTEDWKTLGDSLLSGDAANNPSADSLQKIVSAYALGDTKTFNTAVDDYLKSMETAMPSEMRRVRTESWFNHFAPFYQCANLYVLVLLLSIASWVVWQEPLRRAAFSLAGVVAVVHTLALILRMYLTGRPPVTNLYSSAVFIGWGCILLCLGVECIYRNSIPLVVASVLGFATMIVAHHLGGSGDTMEVMQAVLDTNFWLATHVTTVTLGYTATFVAGFFAMVFIFRMLSSAVRKFFADKEAPVGGEAVLFMLSVVGWLAIPTLLVVGIFCGLWVLWSGGEVLSLGVAVALSLPLLVGVGIYAVLMIVRRFSKMPEPTPEGELPPLVNVLDRLALTQGASKGLSGMVYGTVCFATLLSFVGTVLGGIWADQSWGRFWGWDPKENGALLIVIMNAMVLHARWGGMVRERGLAVLAIVGNMVTAWSWFGTNQLGVGLHAYGFNNTLAMGCSIFWVSQVGLMGLAMMPLRFWRAYPETPGMAASVPSMVPPGPKLSGKRGGSGIQKG